MNKAQKHFEEFMAAVEAESKAAAELARKYIELYTEFWENIVTKNPDTRWAVWLLVNPDLRGSGWGVAISRDLLEQIKSITDRLPVITARDLDADEIWDEDELARRLAEAKEDAETDDLTAEELQEEIDAIKAELRWNDKMLIMPVERKDGTRHLIACAERTAVPCYNHELVGGIGGTMYVDHLTLSDLSSRY